MVTRVATNVVVKTKPTMRQRIQILFFSLLLATTFASCNKSVFYSNDQRVDDKGWNMNDKRYFEVEVTDTLRLYTFFFDLRVSQDYAWDRAFFFINTTFPDGSVAKDTLGCPLAEPDGRWYGKRTGKYIDNRYVFRSNMIFPTTGTYRFEIAHAMRDTNIVGIKNVGLHIEYSK